ncbi:MAG: FliM/FliN family flagellar motor switch protein [Phycisphaerae bacterium]|nr:FliM/FliN family flagellar motor switch protein [Phycisphaerae bacterium]
MPSDVSAILRLEVPIIVRLGERSMKLSEIVGLVPGAIIELEKSADEELDILVNNKCIGRGEAVKVGENFGIWVCSIGGAKERIEAISGR